MTDKEISIKSSLETIQVPSEKLDHLIDDALFPQSSRKSPSQPKWKRRLAYMAASAAIFIGILTSSAIASPAFANYMAQIPVVGNVFSYFEEDEQEKEALEPYKKFSETVRLSQNSGGVEILIDQAVYDGTTVTITYLMKTEKPLSEALQFTGLPEVKKAQNGSTSWEVKYVEDVGYVGIFRLNPTFAEPVGQANVSWRPAAIRSGADVIEGDWSFEFGISQLSLDPMDIDEKVEDGGVAVHIKKVTFTDVSVNVDYQQLIDPALLETWEAVEAEMIARDNLGNVYKVPHNGGFTLGTDRTREDFHWTATLRGLNPEAVSLTFYPFAHISRMTDEMEVPDVEKIVFDAIEIDLIDQTHTIVKDPVLPVFPEEAEKKE